MAGFLLYTSAPDSEGTLGGLMRLGETDELDRLFSRALERLKLCSSDPLCATHVPAGQEESLHAAACHSCLFLPETSCERGNRFLDRALVVPVLGEPDLAFFRRCLTPRRCEQRSSARHECFPATSSASSRIELEGPTGRSPGVRARLDVTRRD